VLVVGFPAAAFATNCYVVATAAGEECVVVDPGIGVERQLDEVLREHRLRPVAVLLTHGHLDHTFSAAPVCGARGIPAYVHPSDTALLADPGLALSPQAAAMFAGSGLSYSEPADVVPLPDGGPISLAGLTIQVDHAPGHTQGSVLFALPGDPDNDSMTVLSGDVLFAGSNGRTDLPGGDLDAMMATLASKILTLPDETVVLPGHGPGTTIGRERQSNPFLHEAVHRQANAQSASPQSASPVRLPATGGGS
jgi:glyoxylase-like metal-dependent hydrolase (beta-lactamase superfamily II)